MKNYQIDKIESIKWKIWEISLNNNSSFFDLKGKWILQLEKNHSFLTIEWDIEINYWGIKTLTSTIKISVTDIISWNNNNFLIFWKEIENWINKFKIRLLVLLHLCNNWNSYLLKGINQIKSKPYLTEKDKEKIQSLELQLEKENLESKEKFLQEKNEQSWVSWEIELF